MSTIKVSDFSLYPAGRTRADGPNSGARFREDTLVPALQTAIEKNDTLFVKLDDVQSYGSSFLEEAFGGLFRNEKFNSKEINKTLKIIAERPIYQTYKRQIELYMKEASKVGGR